MSLRHQSYEDYIAFQKKKTEDPVRRAKWLGEEWDIKLNGFMNEFKRFSSLLKPNSKVLCLGARTGQEVVALKSLGVQDVTGIDIVPHEPHVVYGDIHDLEYANDTFDFVYTNIIDHSSNPTKMISEMERVLKRDGFALIQTQIGLNQDEYTEFEIKNPFYDVIARFESSYCVHLGFINQDRSPNFAGMNFEFVFQKDSHLDSLLKNHGTMQTIMVPPEYVKIWSDINEKIQKEKARNSGLSDDDSKVILDKLSKRAYFLTCLAEEYDCKRIGEVGTAQGWQYYTFCKYLSSVDGKAYTCDPRDVRAKEYANFYEVDAQIGTYVQGTSHDMSLICGELDMIYVDGLHDKGDVIKDVNALLKNQAQGKNTIWIFDDFDMRFGCFEDISQICQISRRFKIVNIGKTASGHESHQVIVCAKFM